MPEYDDGAEPVRHRLSPEVLAAARRIHPVVWTEHYRPGEGPMHYAGGPYWRNELLRLAKRWRKLADAAEVCAGALPGDGPAPDDRGPER